VEVGRAFQGNNNDDDIGVARISGALGQTSGEVRLSPPLLPAYPSPVLSFTHRSLHK